MKRSTRQFDRRRAGGFTLTEMLVSVAVLSVMVIAFSAVLSQTSKVVSGTQLAIRANSAAMSISDVIRRDMSQITKNGFLYIKSNGSDNDVLIFTSAGVYHSLTANATALAIVPHYGLTNNQAAGATGKILFRQGWLLAGDGTVSTTDDIWDDGSKNIDFSSLQGMTVSEILALCGSMASSTINLTVPPQSLDDVGRMWRVLAPRVTGLSIKWGTVSSGTITWNDATNGPSAGAGLWTRHDKTNWPDLVRIRIMLDSAAFEKAGLPKGNSVYEVVCRVGQ